jgi:hypothetical protein
MLKQIGATHCKLYIFVIRKAFIISVTCMLIASRLYVSPYLFQLLVAHLFLAFRSSNCIHLYCLILSHLLHKKSYALCAVLMLIEHCSLTELGHPLVSRSDAISSLRVCGLGPHNSGVRPALCRSDPECLGSRLVENSSKRWQYTQIRAIH